MIEGGVDESQQRIECGRPFMQITQGSLAGGTLRGPSPYPFSRRRACSFMIRQWRRTARPAGVFIALAGDITTPADIGAATERGQMYTLLCPVTLTTP